MGERTLLEFSDGDTNCTYTIIEKWCMCGGCEDFELIIRDLDDDESVKIETFSGLEFENGYVQNNMAQTIIVLAEEIVRLRKLLEKGE